MGKIPNKNRKKKVRATLRFSIRGKLILIIGIIVLASLGSITGLVSWLFRQDLRITAEDNNFEVNRRSALETENFLVNIRNNSQILLQTTSALGYGSNLANQTVEYFFSQNKQVAALLLVSEPGKSNLLVNKRFFETLDIDPSPVETFVQNYEASLVRAASGETIILNVAEWFKTPLLTMFFPWQNGAGAAIFSSTDLNDNFGIGPNQSYLINDSGDILVHPEYDLVRGAVNVSENFLTILIYNSSQKNAQVLYTDEDNIRFFGAYSKLNIGGAVVITKIEFSKVFEGIDATTRRNIYLTAAVLCISILFIWFFSKSITVPIKTLAAAASSIESGNFEIKLTSKSSDEIGFLTSRFQQMCTALAIFGKFTNREVALRAMRGEIKPGGLPKLATIFFSDIRGFSEKSANFTRLYGEEAPNHIIKWLNDYFGRMVECIVKTGGVVDKFDGDAIMAHWGTVYTSGSPQKDAFNCIFSALMMRKVLHKMNKSRRFDDPLNPPIRIGCGINTGMVTAGQIGSDLKMEYTVIGDPVNLAYRTESLNKPLATDILITENTHKLVKNLFITEERTSIVVKGRDNPVKIFAVINFAGINKGPKNIADVRKLLSITPATFQRRLSDISVERRMNGTGLQVKKELK